MTDSSEKGFHSLDKIRSVILFVVIHQLRSSQLLAVHMLGATTSERDLHASAPHAVLVHDSRVDHLGRPMPPRRSHEVSDTLRQKRSAAGQPSFTLSRPAGVTP